MDNPPGARRSPALVTRERALGLRRVTVVTALGRLAVRAGRRTGGTQATILLHGAAGSWTTWTPLLATSDRAGRPITDVVAIDLPGWGESGDLRRGTGVAAVADAVAVAARSLGYARWQVVGHSLGGFVALELAARHPHETVGVTLVSPSGTGVVDAIRRPLRGGLRLPSFAGMLLAMRVLAALGPLTPPLLRTLQRAGALRPLASPLFAHPHAVHASVVAALAAEIRPVAFLRAARAAARYDLSRWRRIACPVVLVRGRRDVFAASADAADFAARIRGVRAVVLDDAGHFAHVERPDAVLAALPARSAPTVAAA